VRTARTCSGVRRAQARTVRRRARPRHTAQCAADPGERDAVDRALLATGFPYDRRERRDFYFTFWEAFMIRTQGVRRTGSPALDLWT
jgi:fructose-1,6-bisphosphatase/inositol monophosphatase family enzyme